MFTVGIYGHVSLRWYMLKVLDETTGLFEFPRMAIGDFQKFLKTHGINCQVGDAAQEVTWVEDPTSHTREQDKVHVRLTQPQDLDRVRQLHQTWDGGNVPGNASRQTPR